MNRFGILLAVAGIILYFCGAIIDTYAETNGKSNSLNSWILSNDIAHIGPSAISMPLGRIILIRHGSDCCALQFTDAFTFGYGLYKGEPLDAYAHYVAYYQGDGTGDFSKQNVKYLDVELLEPTDHGFWASLFGPKKNNIIVCGHSGLAWGLTSVHFFTYPEELFNPQSIIKYGVELAPTPWTRIQDVNIQDPRIKWYKYDEGRPEIKVQIDKIWSNTPLEPIR
jgi:hypothetical protein